MNKNKIQKLVDSLPDSCGIYLMKNSTGKIIYVGKAKNIALRVRSYFLSGNTDTRFFTKNIDKLVSNIDFIVTQTEKEAWLLENNFIKELTPKYNILLRDDKEYLSFNLDIKSKWPRLKLVRKFKFDGSLHFGPYHCASKLREVHNIIKRNFQLRTCRSRQMKNRVRPCLQYQILRCMAPCVAKTSRFEYMKQVEYVRLFLLGKNHELVKKMKTEMVQKSNLLKFEKAARLRDQIEAVESILEPQIITSGKNTNQDIIGYHSEDSHIQILVLIVRGGRVADKADYYFEDSFQFPDEVLTSFILQRYEKLDPAPRQIIIPFPLDGAKLIGKILSAKRKHKIQIYNPKRGKLLQLTTMAVKNAKQLLQSKLYAKEKLTQNLKEIHRRLKLKQFPKKIECVDISHLGGTLTVGALSTLENGKINKKLGRIYQIRKVKPGDDYAAVFEVLSRRFKRIKDNDKKWQAPQLLLVDGGRGQLQVALAALKQLAIPEIPLAAIAKTPKNKKGQIADRIFLPERKNYISIKDARSPLTPLVLARDEAHRLAVKFQQKKRGEKLIQSKLDSIKGVGHVTAKKLLKTFGSVKKIKSAKTEELLKIPGIGQSLAKKIKKSLN